MAARAEGPGVVRGDAAPGPSRSGGRVVGAPRDFLMPVQALAASLKASGTPEVLLLLHTDQVSPGVLGRLAAVDIVKLRRVDAIPLLILQTFPAGRILVSPSCASGSRRTSTGLCTSTPIVSSWRVSTSFLSGRAHPFAQTCFLQIDSTQA
ncbi:unnamed protein product [Prorocentrum cordatum]|uniref:Uncharacterized protein n=1 Tax=Prorocentrum cordatum TaxID=2364126 RepID=A0ABN9UJN4_9DINO|nr:unnamed protein product [Polarella glacialis]